MDISTTTHPLATLAEIRSGYMPRRRGNKTPCETFFLILEKDLVPNATLLPASLRRIHIPAVPGHHLLQPGDLVFRPRCPYNVALAIDESAANTICGTALFSIRIHDKQRLLPAYLAWFINLHATQRYLHHQAAINQIKALRRKSVQALEIPLPSVARQQRIVDIAAVEKNILAVEKSLAEKRLLYTETILLRTARLA